MVGSLADEDIRLGDIDLPIVQTKEGVARLSLHATGRYERPDYVFLSASLFLPRNRLP